MPAVLDAARDGLDPTVHRPRAGFVETLEDLARVSESAYANGRTGESIRAARILHGLGLTILATRGTAKFLTENGIPSDVVNKAYEGGRTVVDVLKDGLSSLVINTTEGTQAIEDSRSMRNVTLMDKIPYFTTAAGAHAAALAMASRAEGDLTVRSLQG